MRRYGDDPDKAAEIVFGEGDRVSMAFDKALEVGDDWLKVRISSFDAGHEGKEMLVVRSLRG